MNIQKITTCLTKQQLNQIKSIKVFDSIPSTNDYLLQSDIAKNSICICLAEQQTAGKGRRGRRWISPPESNIYLSISWPLSDDSDEFNGLSLVSGIAVVSALKEFVSEIITTKKNELHKKSDFKLKWPNDILYDNRKLAGILIECTKKTAIIGIGLNVNMPEDIGSQIDQPYIDVKEIIGKRADRDHLTGLVLHHMLKTLNIFKRPGFRDVILENA
jgi:BirA family biotin operon repressor/biotin-[acetyl-CoA-carboxylase] ligase